MQDLRIILIILGAAAIAALLIHGLWTSQKGRQKPMREKPIGKMDNRKAADADDPFDSDGIGKVRVLDSHQAASLSRDREIEDDWQISPHFSALSEDELNEPSLDLPPTLSSSVFDEDPSDDEGARAEFMMPSAAASAKAPVRDKAELNPSSNETAAELRARQYQAGDPDPLFDAPAGAKQAPATPDSSAAEPLTTETLATETLATESLTTDVLATDKLATESLATAPAPAPNSERPTMASATADTAAATADIIEPASDKPAITKTWQDVYVVNLMAKPNQMISGNDLLRAVTNVGFVFGDMEIFHRYQGASTEGEPLFSLANMVNPGTFKPEAMSGFTTPGVSIFMQLPKPGMAKNNFNMMMQAAGNMAEELDAVLLDGQRQTLSLDYYVRCRAQLTDFDSQA